MPRRYSIGLERFENFVVAVILLNCAFLVLEKESIEAGSGYDVMLQVRACAGRKRLLTRTALQHAVLVVWP